MKPSQPLLTTALLLPESSRRPRAGGRALLAAVVLAGCACALSANTAEAQSREELVDRVVASVNGKPITSRDLELYQNAASGATALPGSAPAARLTGAAALKQLVSIQALEQESKKFKGSVSEAEVDDAIKTVEQQNHLTDAVLKATLTAHGMTYAEYRSQIRLQLEREAMLRKEINSKIYIPQAEINAYYAAHRDEFRVTKEQFKLAQVLIPVAPDAPPEKIGAAKALAEQVYRRALAGESFAALARQYSKDTSASQDGELGNFTRAELIDEVLKAVEKLKPGEISPPVKTAYGFHILKLEQHDLPGYKPLPEASEEIRQKLTVERSRKRFQDWIDSDLLTQYEVETFY
ncbi:MAG: peptidylprolyl isomerase [Deltaproteobacteria bacterium]|jgi:peptidyl-prolyl cis-trans isomerase SurA|nr:peptidylprolyl isomerase [Deltaproteobacteria bacterium]